MMFRMGCGAVLSMEITTTSTSGLSGRASLAKWKRTRKPCWSYTVTGRMLPAGRAALSFSLPRAKQASLPREHPLHALLFSLICLNPSQIAHFPPLLCPGSLGLMDSRGTVMLASEISWGSVVAGGRAGPGALPGGVVAVLGCVAGAGTSEGRGGGG